MTTSTRSSTIFLSLVAILLLLPSCRPAELWPHRRSVRAAGDVPAQQQHQQIDKPAKLDEKKAKDHTTSGHPAKTEEAMKQEEEKNFGKERIVKTDKPPKDEAASTNLFSNPDFDVCPRYPDLKKFVEQKDFELCKRDPSSLLALGKDEVKEKHRFCLVAFVNMEVVCADKTAAAEDKEVEKKMFDEIKSAETMCKELKTAAHKLNCSAQAADKVPACERRNEDVEFLAKEADVCTKFCLVNESVRPLCKHLLVTSKVVGKMMAEEESAGKTRQKEVAKVENTDYENNDDNEENVDEKSEPLAAVQVEAEQEQNESVTTASNETSDMTVATTTSTAAPVTTVGVKNDKDAAPKEKVMVDEDGDADFEDIDKAPAKNTPAEKPAAGSTADGKPSLLQDHLEKYDESVNAQSNFFSYFILISVLCIVFYLVFHNKQKILAMMLEGRRKKNTGRRGRSNSSAQYRKLDNNLEEAGATESSLKQVIY